MLTFWLLLALIALLQIGLLRSFPPDCPVGDEAEYLGDCTKSDPFAPNLFLRVPLYPVVVCLASILSSRPQIAARMINASLAILAAGVMMTAGALTVGEPGIWLIATALLLLPERWILSNHLWPDSLLSLLSGVLILLLLLPTSLSQCLAIGSVLALAALTRIEQLAYLPGVLLYQTISQGTEAIHLALTITPPLLALGFWTRFCYRRYHIPWPDTTWIFNLHLLSRNMRSPSEGFSRTQDRIVDFVSQWRDLSEADRLAGIFHWLKASPLQLASLFGKRFLAYWGPDSFVSQRLLPPIGDAYPKITDGLLKALKTWLRWSFPLISLGCIWLILISPPAYLLVAVFTFTSTFLFHFRTRYRIALLPWIVAPACEGLSAWIDNGLDPWNLALLGPLFLLATWLPTHPLAQES